MITRRNFVLQTAQWLGLSSLLAGNQSCQPKSSFSGNIVGQNFALGHRLRNPDFPKATQEIKTDIAIVGGGIAGLSAARYLKKSTSNFVLLEMNESPGGNSIAGLNSVSAYPWGAHYLPLPGNDDAELIQFLKEAEVINGVENGLPVFNDYYLCFDPKERLFINHYWQEGIIPHEGVPQQDRD